MPGIAGIFTRQMAAEAPQLLGTMLDSMMHETFYTQASHVDQAHGWFCGSVAINGSFADCMPVFNEARDVILFFAGECFTDNHTITALRGRGHESNPIAASHLVHLYEEEGPDFVKKLNGWFSGVVLDVKRGKAVLFNDRYGMQRIYYHEDANAFYFASEAKALLRAVPSLRAAEMRSIAEYLCFDCVLEERSFFRGINVLPGGALWTSQGGSVEKRSHFDPSQLEAQPSLDSEDFLEQLTKMFELIVPRYLAGDRLTIALTGGLDTRLIMACLPRDYRHVTAFTFGGMDRDTMDVRLAREVSQACNISHDTVRLGADFLSDYPRHAARVVYISDGLADATNADQVYMNSCVRKLAPVKLMGSYGSQVMGRVRRALRHRPPAPELLSADFKPHVDDVSDALMPFQHEHNMTFLLKREIPWYWCRFAVPQMSQLMIRSPFLDNDLVDLLYRAPREGFDGSKFEIAAISKYRSELLGIRTNKGALGQSPLLISKIIKMLMKTRSLADKALHWDVLPYSLHHVLTRIDSLILSPLHLNRLVFGSEYFVHYNNWFRHDLAPYLKDVLLDDRTLTRPYWNRQFLTRMVNDHVNGRRRYLKEIRKVLTIELIHRVLLEGDAGQFQ